MVSAARKYGVVRAPAVILKPPVIAETPGTASQALVAMVLLPSSYVPIRADDQPSNGEVGFIGQAQERCYGLHEFEIEEILLVGSKRLKIDAKALLTEKSSARATASSFAAADPFAGMVSLGKKDAGAGTVDNRAETEDKVMTALVDAEHGEHRGNNIPALSLQAMVKRGPDVVLYRQLCDQIEMLTAQMRSFESHQAANLETYYTSIERKETLKQKVEALSHVLSNESLTLFPDFLQRKVVLKRLGYIDENETVLVKGRVACEVNTCEELIATELVFEGALSELSPPEIVAVLSSLVYQGKSEEAADSSDLPERLRDSIEAMKTIACNLGQLQKECGLEVDPGEYCDQSLNFGLVHVVYEWALGVPFKNICELTDVQEGVIVRTITRLDELCREVRNCARVVGSPSLFRSLEAASAAIKRDIVFASSLYVS